ncbi:MAG: YgiQ family radical SAM protein, partial [Deltaproteobacteria bacterium]|nr:YgiQ family radical SAM protein [Deltaproteobacteria bacterium]
SAGTVDSMINNYTANKKVRSDDMYSEGGKAFRRNAQGREERIRPDYATIAYAKLARRAFPDAPVIAGGVEISLRRLAHFDYWQNRIRPSMLVECDADLVVFGMGERTAIRIAEDFKKASELSGGPLSLTHPATKAALTRLKGERGVAFTCTREESKDIQPRLKIPSFEEVRDDKRKFSKAAYFIEYEASPYNGRRLMQDHGARTVVINPPALPLSQAEMDSIYELPFCKEQHPMYKERIPAADMIRFSVASTRGCFGGCSFCAITLHQGRIVQSRSQDSILKEVGKMTEVPGFKGEVSDIGGPTANMYELRCKSVDIQSKCRKLSCVHPGICPHLHTDHTPQVELLAKARKLPGIKRIRVSSGLRYDIALADKKSGQKYLKDLIQNHVGGHLKVAPEHLNPEVLHLMKKPGLQDFDAFAQLFEKYSKDAGKEQYLVPYFISGFPGTTHEQMEQVYDYMSEKGWRLQQVQAFIPTPMTLATAMYWTGIDPMTKKELFVPKEWRDRKIQQALLQPHKPEHKEILREYRSFLRRRAVEGGTKKDFGTCDSRAPGAPRPQQQPQKKKDGQRKRSIVDVPKNRLGPKLLLDSR